MGTDNHAAEMLSALDLISGRGPMVLVYGDACLDEYVPVESRENPEGDFPRYRTAFVEPQVNEGMAGAVANQATELHADAFLVSTARPRRKVRYQHAGRTVFAVDCDAPVLFSQRADARRRLIDMLDSRPWGALAIVDYQKGIVEPGLVRMAIDYARERQIPIVVEAHNAPAWHQYEGATLIKCNAGQFAAAKRPFLDLFHHVVTDGPAGLRWNMEHYATTPREGDTTGCGDIVTAVLTCCMAVGVELPTACRLANVTAGLKVLKRGAVPVPAAEIRAEIGRMN